MKDVVLPITKTLNEIDALLQFISIYEEPDIFDVLNEYMSMDNIQI